MNAIKLLEDDHKDLKQLMEQGEDTTERAVKTRAAVLQELAAKLTAHEKIEEDIFYPPLKEHPKAKDIVLEGYQEHHVADLIMAELKDMDEDDERWGAKFKVLKENIEHHIEEEEGEMFKTARSVFSSEELEELGERMEQLKAQVLTAHLVRG
jgi:hemerythrin-like domain-containing protein